jgi:LuxR family maltose regulon positive regulatory protein
VIQQVQTSSNYQLKCGPDDLSHIPPIDSSDWYTWINQQQTFSFATDHGSFVARKEKRSSGTYWYAYQSKGGKIYVAYLGKSDTLTLKKLKETLSRLDAKVRKAEHVPEQPIQQVEVVDDEWSEWGENPLMLTKMCIPRLHRSLVSRTPLLERLNEGMYRKLTLVSASAGFGKTVLLSEWATHCRWAVAWVSLDSNSNDPTHFWHYLITALQSIHPHIGKRMLMLTRSAQQVRIEAMLTMLINDLARVTEDFALILDDYDMIHSADVHQSMTFLLDHLPPCMHVFLASRVTPPFSLTRLRAQRQLLELRTSDLCLSDEEIQTFFSQSLGVSMSAETVSLLAARTEGWITGLELIALSAQKQKDVLEFVRTLTRRDTYIHEYLANEILQQQPEDIQDFLLETSILDRLSGPLCDALTDRCDGQWILEQLEKENIFIVPLDDQRDWYRYHHIFRDFLRKRLQDDCDISIDNLYRQAALWYEEAGLPQEAVIYALLGHDFQKAAVLISQIGQKMLQQNEFATLLAWLEMIPEQIIRSFPCLCLFRAWLFLATGQIQEVEAWLYHAQSCLETPSSSVVSCDESQDVQGSIAALRAHLAAFQGNIPHIVDYAKQALVQLSERNVYFRCISAINLGVAYWLSDRTTAAIDAFDQAKKMGYSSNNIYIVLTALCCQTHVLTIQGQLRRAFRVIQQALELIAEQHCDLLWAAADAYICTGQLFYEWDEQETAVAYVEKGLILSKQAGYMDMSAYGSTVLAKIKQAQGETEQAIQVIEQEEYLRAEDPRPSWVISLMDTARVRLALLQDDSERVSRWKNQAQSESRYLNVFEKLTLIRVYIAEGELYKASMILELDVDVIDDEEQKARTVEVFLLKALVFYHQQLPDLAQAALERALTVAEPEGYIRLFVSEGPPMAALLEECLLRRQRGQLTLSLTRLAYVQKLLLACGQHPNRVRRLVSGSTQSRNSDRFQILLNEREQAILQLLKAGMSNREMSDKLVISENTVKWYIKGIYSKIGVHNRAQAVAWASAPQS